MRFPAFDRMRSVEAGDVSPGVEKAVQGHVRRIDVLRAVAILIVFSSHFYLAALSIQNVSVWNGAWYGWADQPSVWMKALRSTVLAGPVGVALFFVISGLCIRLSDFERGSFAVLPFYARRFWRIYPPYLLVLIVATLVLYQPGEISGGNIVSHLFMIHNFSLDYFYSINGPFWSLALEVQCYLLYPVLLLACARAGRFWTGFLLAALSCVSETLCRQSFMHAFSLPATFGLFRQMPTTLWFTWYLGFLLAERLRHGYRLNPIYLLALIPLVALWQLSLFYRPCTWAYDVLLALCLALAVYGYLSLKGPLAWLEKGATWLGLCSYSFYLMFDPLIRPCLHFFTSTLHVSSRDYFFSSYLFTCLIIFGVAWISYQLVEKSSIRLGNQFAKKVFGAKDRRPEVDGSPRDSVKL